MRPTVAATNEAHYPYSADLTVEGMHCEHCLAAVETALDGIGEKKAENIVGYREEHGEFIYPWEITNVDGIGEKTYGKIKNDICAE